MRLKKHVTLIFIILVFFTGCSIKDLSNATKMEYGTLDLSGWDINKKETIQLSGLWEFYQGKFLVYDDFQNVKPDMYVEVPNTWNEYRVGGKSLPGQGYATYRLHIKTGLPEDTLMGLRVYTFSSAYKIYINEKLIAGNGRISENAREEVGEYRPQAVFFSLPAKEFDIIIQVSNFQYARGGFWYTLHMGSAERIMKLHDNIMEKEVFLLGALAIVSIFFLTIFILRKELKYSLYFSCLCMTMAIVMDSLGQHILFGLFPGLGLKGIIFIWYSSSIWVFYFLLLFMHELFKSRFSTIVKRAYLVTAIIFQVIFVITDTTFYTGWFAQISDLVSIIGALCAIGITGIGIKKGQKDGWLNIAGIFTALAAYIHDDLYWMNIITNSYGEITYVGLFIFLFTQMIIQAKRIKLFHEHKTAAELSFLQAQIKPHFLYNTLNSFISISRYDIDKARTLIYDFSNYLRRSFDFKDLSQFVPLKNEIELAKAYAEIEKVRFEERIEVNFEIPEEIDVSVPILMLQPLIENAVIHGILPKPEGGRIDIFIEIQDRNLIIMVKDNGVGMKADKLKSVMGGGEKKGVGLKNIDRRLRKLYGRGLQIKSEPDSGTEITWSIPVNRRWNG